MTPNPASKITLTDGPVIAVVAFPPWVEPASEDAKQQARQGVQLLHALNRVMLGDAAAGGDCGPFQGLIVFNDPEIAAAADMAEYADYFWGVSG